MLDNNTLKVYLTYIELSVNKYAKIIDSSKIIIAPTWKCSTVVFSMDADDVVF